MFLEARVWFSLGKIGSEENTLFQGGLEVGQPLELWAWLLQGEKPCSSGPAWWDPHHQPGPSSLSQVQVILGHCALEHILGQREQSLSFLIFFRLVGLVPDQVLKGLLNHPSPWNSARTEQKPGQETRTVLGCHWGHVGGPTGRQPYSCSEKEHTNLTWLGVFLMTLGQAIIQEM